MGYYINPQKIQQRIIQFNDEQTHHMRKVLRLKIGDKVECFDGKGNIFLVEVKKLSREASFGKILETQVKNLPSRSFSIIQSFPSALPKLDLVIEKCTEIGVDNFIFIKSKRSELYVLPSEDKIQRWKKIAIKASEQSHRYTVPQIYVLENIENVDLTSFDKKLLLYEKHETIGIHINNESKKIVAAIGPEGGWESNEVDIFSSLGFEVVKPFENILRTETAPIAISTLFLTKFI